MNWMELTHLLSSFSLNLWPPFVHLPLHHISWHHFWMYALDKNNTSLLCMLCTLTPQIWPLLTLMLVPGRSLPLIFCIHVRSGPIYWGGGIYLAKNIIRWWYFTCKKPKNSIYDSILHVNMFHYFKIPYLHVIILQNFPTMNILDPIFYRTFFYDFR